MHSKNRSFRRVVGIVTDAGDEPYRTFDLVLLEGDQWSPEMERLASEIESELGVSGRGTIHRITDPYHDPNDRPPATRSSGSARPSRPRRDGRVGRNDPCPCQSGKKFKHCCLRRMQEE